MVEGDGLIAGRDELLVNRVEHLEERHVAADVARRIGDEAPFGPLVLLPPDVERQVHL